MALLLELDIRRRANVTARHLLCSISIYQELEKKEGRDMYYLAQINIGRIRAQLDDPLMAGYVNQRKAMDTLARNSPGFIWRRNGAGSEAKETDVYEDQTIIANISVWARLQDYANFVYKSGHLEVLKHRHEWFQHFDGPYQALWWVPQGHLPTPEEARERLEYLRAHGETPYAFSLKKAFPAPDERAQGANPAR